MVKVSFNYILDLYRITVCGNDDDMMGFETVDETIAINTFVEIVNQDTITKEHLNSIGLEQE